MLANVIDLENKVGILDPIDDAVACSIQQVHDEPHFNGSPSWQLLAPGGLLSEQESVQDEGDGNGECRLGRRAQVMIDGKSMLYDTVLHGHDAVRILRRL